MKILGEVNVTACARPTVTRLAIEHNYNYIICSTKLVFKSLNVGIVLFCITILIRGLIHYSKLVFLGHIRKQGHLQQTYNDIHEVETTPTAE